MPEYYYTSNPVSAHEVRSFTSEYHGRMLTFHTDAGVFSKQHIDPGSALLCRSLPPDIGSRVLDMGCGWGAMTVMTLCDHPDAQVTMADVNARALELAMRNVQANGMRAEAVLSDGFEKVQGMFDTVITNPPIRAGKAVIYRMFEEARTHLVPGGALYLVIRKQQGAPSAQKFLKTLYASAEVIDKDGGYWILRCEA